MCCCAQHLRLSPIVLHRHKKTRRDGGSVPGATTAEVARQGYGVTPVLSASTLPSGPMSWTFKIEAMMWTVVCAFS